MRVLGCEGEGVSGGCEVDIRYVCSNPLNKYISIDVIYQYCGKIDHDAPYKDILPYKEYHTTPYIRRNTMC